MSRHDLAGATSARWPLRLAIAAGMTVAPVLAAAAGPSFSFGMVPSNPACAPKAKASVRITPLGFAERMAVSVTGLKPGTKLDLFAIQVPEAPFAVAWYVGDVDIGRAGKGRSVFVGRFSIETFAVAVGAAPVPTPVHDGRDASGENPAFRPIHTFHLGLWFNSNADAAKNGCPAAPSPGTPFNGDHTAGVQVLNTSGFPDQRGPLRHVD